MVEEMSDRFMKLRKKIQGTLDQEEDNLEAYDPMVFNCQEELDNCRGWVEALRYVLKQIDDICEEPASE